MRHVALLITWARTKGTASLRERRRTPAAAVTLIAAPADLPEAQREVWNELAPHACAAKTLTEGTVAAFRDLIEAIVIKREMLAQIRRDGLTYLKVTIDGSGQEHTEVKAHPLIGQHRGMMQRVEQGMLRFRLSPMGKELEQPEPPEDPFAEFDGGAVQ